MALSGKVTLPSTQEMMNSVQDYYVKLAASGKTKRLAHNLDTSQVVAFEFHHRSPTLPKIV